MIMNNKCEYAKCFGYYFDDGYICLNREHELNMKQCKHKGEKDDCEEMQILHGGNAHEGERL